MRALAFGDTHLGAGLDLGRVPGERLAEQEQVFRAALMLSRERRCDAVLFAGDLFNTPRPSPEIMLAAERPLVDHQVEGGAPVYVIAGNHCIPSADGPSGLDVLAEAGLIELARTPTTWTLTGGVEVCALPWTPVSRLVAADNGQSDRAWINAQAADLIIQAASDMRDPGREQILMLHWSVSGTSLPSGMDVGSLGGVVLPMDDLVAIGYDAIVAGHIHRGAQYGDRFLYVGSPQPLNFGEEGCDHGCWILEIDAADGETVGEFVPLPSRRFLTVTMDGRSVECDWPGVEGAYVKVRATLTEEDHRRFDPAAVRAELEREGAHTVTFDLTVERNRRDRGATLDDNMTPQDQLAAYLAAVGVNGALKPAMLARASQYLEANDAR